MRVKTRLTGARSNAEGLEQEGRGYTLFSEKWRRTMSKWDTEIAEASKREAPRPVYQDGAHDENSDPNLVTDVIEPIGLVDAFPIVRGEIPPRRWVAPGLLMKRHVSVTVAPPGTGKSLLTLQLAIAMALGMSWGGWEFRGRQKVLVINAEDDLDEMKRRLVAAAEKMGVDQQQLAGWVFLAEAPESIVIARTDPKTKTVTATPLKARLTETITSKGITVAIADPFAETFEGEENNNSEVKWAAAEWRDVARKTDCAIWLIHHTRKYATGMAGDMDASRGASALTGIARVISTIFGMSEQEAKLMNIEPEDRNKYVRFDDAKASYTLATRMARWFEKVSVNLMNGNGLIPGDEVGVLMPWTPPGLFDDVSVSQISLVMDKLTEGPRHDDGRLTGTLFGAHHNSKPWAGEMVEDVFGWTKERAGKAIKFWLDHGNLEEVKEKKDGKERGFIRVKNRPDGRPV
jgi:hypothetical protein